MNIFSFFYIGFGVLYLIYVYVKRCEITFYFKRKYSKIIDDRAYGQLQLSVSLLNGVYLILFGMAIRIFGFNTVLFLAGLIPFHLMNAMLVLLAKQKGYVALKSR